MHSYPPVAIDGIAAEQFSDIAATGVESIAVVLALVNVADLEAAARDLMARLRNNSQSGFSGIRSMLEELSKKKNSMKFLF